MQFRAARAAIFAVFASLAASPVMAAGEIVITQAKALAGNVTPGDTAGYPVTLSVPGAYVLESNLNVTPGTYGLFVTAGNVDIDMNGFTLSGAGGGTYGLISGFGESRIHDGVISAFQFSGLYLRADAWTINDMQIVRNGNMGVDATDALNISVSDSLVAKNTSHGAQTGDNGSFRDSTFSGNGGRGISCLKGCEVSTNIINKNLHGVWILSGFVTENTIAYNAGFGIIDNAGGADTGYSNNMLVANSVGNAAQTLFVEPVHPNKCTGLPC